MIHLALVPSFSPPPHVRPAIVPSTAVVGAPWRAVVAIDRPTAATLVARGPVLLRARLVPALRQVVVDIPRDARILDPITIVAEPTGSLLVGQLRRGPVLRVIGGKVTTVADGPTMFQLSVSGATAYATARDGAVHGLDGSVHTRDAAARRGLRRGRAAGNLYVAIYAGYVKKVAPEGTVYVLEWENLRILRLAGGRFQPVARG